jgi:polysaccharide export outer membrane protein
MLRACNHPGAREHGDASQSFGVYQGPLRTEFGEPARHRTVQRPQGIAGFSSFGKRGDTMASDMTSRFMSNLLRAAASFLLVLGLAACSFNRYPPAPATSATADYAYKIGPLDSISIIVWRNPELSTIVPVRPDGKISTALVTDMQAAGLTPQELSLSLQGALTKYIREPVVSVVVTTFQGASTETIRIIGEAARPQALPYRQGMTLLDVMIQVGGLTEFADGNGAVLVRGKEGSKQYSVRLKDLLKRGDISANVEVSPGDVLIIPQGWF